jgi:hypothetical protein
MSDKPALVIAPPRLVFNDLLGFTLTCMLPGVCPCMVEVCSQLPALGVDTCAEIR